ncbi:MAG: tetratricopeptide repeat protein, partial [Planctomycetota bacterium]
MANLEKARSSYEAALLIREQESPGSSAHAIVLDNLAAALSFLGELDKALSMQEQALAIFEGLGGPINVDVATTLGNMSRVFLLQGNFQKAEAYRLRALDTHERLTGLNSPGTLLDVQSLAELYMAKGDRHRVDSLVNLLLSPSGGKIGKGHRFLAQMLFELTRKAFDDFQLDLAERLGTLALEAFEKTEGMDAPETLNAVQLLANIQRSTNHIGPAQKNYKRALDGYNARKMTDSVAQVTIDLAKTYCDAGSYELAQNMFTAAIKMLRNSPKDHNSQIASALGNLAVLYYESERYDLADQTYAEALVEIQTETKNIERPWLLHNRAMLKYHLGEYDSARLLYGEAKKTWSEEHGDEHPFVATTASNLGLVQWATGNIASAVDFFTEAEAIRDRDMQRCLTVGSEAKRAAYATHLVSDLHLIISLCFATKPYREALGKFAAQMLLRRKGRVLDAIAHTYFQVRENTRPTDKAIFDRLETIRRDISNMIAPVLGTQRSPQEPQQLSTLREEEEELEAKLSYRGALYQPVLDKVTLEAVQQQISHDGALIELMRYPVFDPERTGKKGPWRKERYAAMVLQAANGPHWFDLGPATDIDSQVKTMLRCIRRSTTSIEECRYEAVKLHELVMEPLKNKLVNVRHLFVGPDGNLSLAPFGFLQ